MNIKTLQFLGILVLPILFLASCGDDDDVTPTPPNNPDAIEAKYREYVDRFVTEGVDRGFDVDISELTVVEGIAPQFQEFCGYGYSNYNSTGRPRVEISDVAFCWDDRNDIEKEALMFHELGHAILARQHKETTYSNTLPTSMMCSEACAGANLFFVYNTFTPGLRKYYIDELFDPLVDPPSWLSKTDTTQFYTDDFEDDNSEWTFEAVGDDQGAFTANRYDTTMTGDIALSITSDGSLGFESFAYWLVELDAPDIPEGAELKVTAIMDLEQVTGDGLSLVARTDVLGGDDLQISGFETTQGSISFNGTEQDRQVSVIMPYFPNRADKLSVFFLLGGEINGKVYCKDILVEVME